jgi:hypothetical protein
MSVRVPVQAHKEVKQPDVGFTEYRFSTPSNRHHGITLLYDVLDEPGFLDRKQMTKAHFFWLNGLKAWRYVGDGMVSIQVNLPDPPRCIQHYALATYSAGDHWSADIAKTLSLLRPYHCSNVMP